MIEALIAALILAIGVMGLVSLLTMSKVSQYEGMQRIRAVSLGDDIIERIRRNPAGLAVYDIGLSSPLGDASITAEPSPNCNSASCTAAQLASHDLWAWERLLDGTFSTVTDDEGNVTNTMGMKNVSACIEITPDTGKTNTGIVDVVLQWQGLKETKDAVGSGETVCGDATDEDATRRQTIVSSYVLDETEI